MWVWFLSLYFFGMSKHKLFLYCFTFPCLTSLVRKLALHGRAYSMYIGRGEGMEELVIYVCVFVCVCVKKIKKKVAMW